MSHVDGEVADTLEAIVRLRFNTEVEVDCVVDTGFSGALVLPRNVVNQLNLPIIGHETFEMVGGTQASADIALGQIDWLGEPRAASM